MTTLLDTDSPIGFDAEVKPLDCLPGKICVEMPANPEKIGSLYVPGYEYFRPSIGRVISNGGWAEKRQGELIFAPEFGTRVLIAPEDGLQLMDPEVSSNEIRFYGYWWDGAGDAHTVDWWESILMEVTPDGLRAYGDRVLVKPDHVSDKTEGGIFLLDESKPKPMRGTVVSSGQLARDVEPGDRIMYDPSIAPFNTTCGHVIMSFRAVLAKC